MEPVIIDAGTLQFSEEDLTATGILVPYGVKCRSNLGEFEVGTGVFRVPTDLTGASLNVEHQREDVVGGLARVWEQPEGMMGTFKFAATDEGRRAFADAKSGKRKNLSAEVAKVTIRAGKAISGRVFGAALVERPAFAGATLLAAEDTEAVSDPYLAPESESKSQYINEYTDDDGVKWRRVEEHVSTTTVTKITDAEAPAEDTEETEEQEGSTMTASAIKPGQAPAPVASTLLASGSAPTAPAASEDIDLGSIFASMAAIKTGMSNQTGEHETLLAALSDIKYNAVGGLTTSASGVIQPAWVGKLWQGLRYVRKYIDLGTHLYGGIQLGGRKGFTLAQGTALVQHWAGNKADVPSGTATTATKGSTLQKYAYGADVAREWYDLEGGADVIQAFFEGVRDSYAELSDEDALIAIIAAAATNAVALDKLIDPGTYPTEYPVAMGMLIDAIERVSDSKDEASFAVVNPAAYRELLFTPKDLVPEFISFAFRAGTGQGTADGKVTVVKAADEFFPGLDATEPAVAAGAKAAIEFREQGSTPIEVDALNIAKGGIDKAVIGYMETFVVRPESFVLLGTEDA